MKLERINQIYEELSKYSIELAEDPTTMGPQYIVRMTSECRNFLNSVTRILLEIHRDRQNTANRLGRLRGVFAIKSDDLLASNADVIRRPNIRDREAAIKVILKEDVAEIVEAEEDLRNLDAIATAVKLCHAELVRTDGQIRTQRSAIQDEIKTKSFYGDENSNNHQPPIDEEELENLLSGHIPPTREPPKVSTKIFDQPEGLDEATLPPSQVVPDREPKEPVTQEAPVATQEPVVEASAPVVTPEEPVVQQAAPEPPKEPETDLTALLDLAATEGALVSAVEEPKAPPAPDDKTPDAVEDIEKFLSEPSVETGTESPKPATKRGRKTAPKEEVVAPVVKPSSDDDIDFTALLSSLLSS